MCIRDSHCGGVDLKFPHHENEIAQSCCANKEEKFANYWVHNEFLNLGSGEKKMSKSLGNVILVHDMLKEWDGEVIRLALLKAHYRSELNWSEDLLKESKAQLDGWYRLEVELNELLVSQNLKYTGGITLDQHEFEDLLYNDLAIPDWISKFSKFFRGEFSKSAFFSVSHFSEAVDVRGRTLFHLAIRQVDLLSNNRRTVLKTFEDKERLGQFVSILLNSTIAFANLLGLLQKDPKDWFKGGASSDDQAEFDAIALRRQEARAAKDWAAADAARDEAKAKGIVLEDKPDGSTEWRKA